MTRTTEKDAVLASIRKALRAAKAARDEANGDMRTNSTVCAEYLDTAVRNLEAAAGWMAELRAEEKRNERAEPKPAPKPTICHVCEEEIVPDDIAICGGCDQPTCPECINGEYCRECAEDGD